MQIKSTRRLSIFVLCVMAAALCSGMGAGGSAADIKKEHIAWPPPPWPPKIEFVSSVTTPDDMHIKKGFFRRMWEFVAGESREGLIKPYGVFVDDNGRLYVTDTAAQAVHVFDPREGTYFLFKDLGKGQRLSSPIDVKTDSSGNIYVSDSGRRRVFVFGQKGKFLREIGGDGRMQRPTGIALDRTTGTLFVADTVASKVLVYTLDGKYKKAIGSFGAGPKQFNRPTFLALGTDGNLYVSDSMNARVQIVGKGGKFVGRFGIRGTRAGEMADPRGIALDSEGHIYITDTLFNAVSIFDKSGRALLVFGGLGVKHGNFVLPAGISISNDVVYVADSNNMRVQVFKYLKDKDTEKMKNSK